MTTELLEIVIVRKHYGIVARGPILSANGNQGVAAILGPVEALPGDYVSIIAEGREASTWVLEQPFQLAMGLAIPQCAVIYFPLDNVGQCSTKKSFHKFKVAHVPYLAGANDPKVRVVLP